VNFAKQSVPRAASDEGARRAREILGEVLDLAPESIAIDAAMDRLPQWGSLNHIRLISRLEEELGRPVEREEMLAIVELQKLAVLLDG
jgi:acyl carrier protein